MNRWNISEVAGLLGQPRVSVGTAWELYRGQVQPSQRFVRELAEQSAGPAAINSLLIAQQSIAAVGVGVGLSPPQFAALEGMPAIRLPVDEILGAFAIVGAGGSADQLLIPGKILELLQSVLTSVLESIQQVVTVVADALGMVPVVGQIIGAVLKGVVALATMRERWNSEASQSAIAKQHCLPRVILPTEDDVGASAALGMLSSSDFTGLFMPTVDRLRCCWPGDLDSRRFLEENQDVGRFGLTPMTGQHLVFDSLSASRRHPGRAIESGDDAALLGGVGAAAWRLIWTPGPASLAVDSAAIADEWQDVFASTIEWIARAEQDCDLAGEYTFGRRSTANLFYAWRLVAALQDRIRPAVPVPVPTLAATGGKPNSEALLRTIAQANQWASNNAIATAWRAHERYQSAMMSRPEIAYADADSVPAGLRLRVVRAQRSLLDSPDVCGLDVDSIPELAYRAEVVARRIARGPACGAGPGGILGPTLGSTPLPEQAAPAVVQWTPVTAGDGLARAPETVAIVAGVAVVAALLMRGSR